MAILLLIGMTMALGNSRLVTLTWSRESSRCRRLRFEARNRSASRRWSGREILMIQVTGMSSSPCRFETAARRNRPCPRPEDSDAGTRRAGSIPTSTALQIVAPEKALEGEHMAVRCLKAPTAGSRWIAGSEIGENPCRCVRRRGSWPGRNGGRGCFRGVLRADRDRCRQARKASHGRDSEALLSSSRP